ncbi:MAG: gluconokinase [Nocardioidaceae bacterium]|nr:gluconokinase [Nocardioidaceae bacterium]
MGVAGSGKSTVARALVRRTGWTMLEGDDLHPPENVEKMAAGTPLTDADRWPWLDAIGAWVDGRRGENVESVVTCSALRRGYRDRLRQGRPGVVFCFLEVPSSVLVERLGSRTGHYFPAQLLRSQLATLEPLDSDEPGFVVGGAAEVDVVAETVLALLHEQRVRS